MLLPVIKHSFFWSEENVIPNNFPTLDGVSVLVCPVIFLGHCNVFPYIYGRYYCHMFLRHQVCLGRCYCHVICGRWCNHRGRWYYLLWSKVADVIANWFCSVRQMVSDYVCMLQLIFDRCCCQDDRGNGHQGGHSKHGRCYGHKCQMK